MPPRLPGGNPPADGAGDDEVRGTVKRLIGTAASATAAIVVAVGVTACGSSGAAEGPTSDDTLAAVQSGKVTVEALDNNFVPQTITVTTGTEVTFVNDGRNQHNVLKVENTPFEVETASFEPGETYTWTATEPGTYRYYCSIHGTATAGMTGTVQVVAP